MREDEYEELRMRHDFGSSGKQPPRRNKELPPEKKAVRITEAMYRQMAAKLMAGASEREVADDFNVSRSTVQRAKRMYFK